MLRSVLARSCVQRLPVTRKARLVQRTMAGFKFSYVRSFEPNDRVSPDQWIVVTLENKDPEFRKQVMNSRQDRIKFTHLMDKNATDVMNHFRDVRFSYVHSTNAHFAFDGKTNVHQRRSSKLLSHLASCLASACVINWSEFLDVPMRVSPCFDGKIHVFPNDQHLRDYFTLCQMNHHLENLRCTLTEAINGDHPNIKTWSPPKLEVIDDLSTFECPGDSDAGSTPVLGVPGEVEVGKVDPSASDNLDEASILQETDSQHEGIDGGDPAPGSCDGVTPADDLGNQTSPPSKNGLDEGVSRVEGPLTSPTPDKKTLLATAAIGSEAYCNEQLYSRFRINYNNEPDALKKGSFLSRQKIASKSSKREPRKIIPYREDLRKTAFWDSLSLLAEETKFNAKFYMIPKFQQFCTFLPHAWVVVRLDGKGFHKLARIHGFQKPNDLRAIKLMNISAATLMTHMPDVVIAYGESDEFSFVFQRYGVKLRRSPESLVAQCVSIFSAAYVKNWPLCFAGRKSASEDNDSAPKKDAECGSVELHVEDITDSTEEATTEPEKISPDSRDVETGNVGEEVKLKSVPIFDGRAVVYPTTNSLRDYLSWRQADCHVNNMYNTAFWALVQKQGYTRQDAEKKLNGTFSKDKRQILLDMGIDYDEEPAIHRKGSVLFRTSKARGKSGYFRREFKLVRDEAWWTEECQAVKAERLRLRKLYYHSYSPTVLRDLLEAEIRASRLFKKAKAKYLNESRAAVPDATSLPDLQDSSSSSGKDATSDALVGEADLDKNSASEPAGNAEEVSDKSADDLPLSSACETDDFRDKEVVIPDGFLDNFETRYTMEHVSLETKKEVLNTFHMKEKPWWTLECHIAKVIRLDAIEAYRQQPSEETERIYHLACIRFKAIVLQSKTRYKKLQALQKVMPSKEQKKSSQENGPRVAGDENLDGSQEPSSNNEGVDSLSKIEDFVYVTSPSEGQDETTDGEAESDAPKTEDVVSSEPKESAVVEVEACEGSQSTEASPEAEVQGGNSEVQNQKPLDFKSLSSVKLGEHQEALVRVTQHVAQISAFGGNLVLCFDDVIQDRFWRQHPHLLGCERSAMEFDDTL